MKTLQIQPMLLLDWTDPSRAVTGLCASFPSAPTSLSGHSWGSGAHLAPHSGQQLPQAQALPLGEHSTCAPGTNDPWISGPRTAPNHHTLCADSFLWVAGGDPHCAIVRYKVSIRPGCLSPRRYGCPSPASEDVNSLVQTELHPGNFTP